MIKSSPLHGKKVLVPRGKGQATSFSRLIEKYGGVPVEIPLIAFRPIEVNQHLKTILKSLDTYNWMIFTSSVCVETFFSLCEKMGRKGLPKIAVIGKKTEEALLANGYTADFVPSVYVAESFVEEFLPRLQRGSRVLVPKGNLAREYIADSLTACGMHVDEAVIYETYMPVESRGRLAEMLVGNQLDILLFTSPSTVDHFMDVIQAYKLEAKLKGFVIGCIGPSTEKKLHEKGLPVHVSPKEFTVNGMIKSTIAYLGN